MGRVASKLVRRVETRFNAENRAQKFIERQKATPQAPPKYESSMQMLKEIEQKYPDLKKLQSQKDTSLDDRLKQVRIDSFGTTPEIKALQKLPQDRAQIEDPRFGHLEPQVLAPGKLSIRQLMEGLEKSMLAPLEYTHVEFAREYNLDVQKAKTIFHYFKPYNLYTDMSKELKEQYKELAAESAAESPGFRVGAAKENEAKELASGKTKKE